MYVCVDFDYLYITYLFFSYCTVTGQNRRECILIKNFNKLNFPKILC